MFLDFGDCATFVDMTLCNACYACALRNIFVKGLEEDVVRFFGFR